VEAITKRNASETCLVPTSSTPNNNLNFLCYFQLSAQSLRGIQISFLMLYHAAIILAEFQPCYDISEEAHLELKIKLCLQMQNSVLLCFTIVYFC